MQLSVKNVMEKVFREFKAQAVLEDLPVGEALNQAMKLWMNRYKKPKLHFMDLKPTHWGDPHTSEKIDEILYDDPH